MEAGKRRKRGIGRERHYPVGENGEGGGFCRTTQAVGASIAVPAATLEDKNNKRIGGERRRNSAGNEEKGELYLVYTVRVKKDRTGRKAPSDKAGREHHREDEKKNARA